MKKVIFLIILIQSLVLLPAAHGGDSWVLWEKVDHQDLKNSTVTEGAEWNIVDAYTKEADCKAHIAQAWSNTKNKWENLGKLSADYKLTQKPRVRSEPYYVIVVVDQGAYIVNFQCLPSTLDPRR